MSPLSGRCAALALGWDSVPPLHKGRAILGGEGVGLNEPLSLHSSPQSSVNKYYFGFVPPGMREEGMCKGLALRLEAVCSVTAPGSPVTLTLCGVTLGLLGWTSSQPQCPRKCWFVWDLALMGGISSVPQCLQHFGTGTGLCCNPSPPQHRVCCLLAHPNQQLLAGMWLRAEGIQKEAPSTSPRAPGQCSKSIWCCRWLQPNPCWHTPPRTELHFLHPVGEMCLFLSLVPSAVALS